MIFYTLKTIGSSTIKESLVDFKIKSRKKNNFDKSFRVTKFSIPFFFVKLSTTKVESVCSTPYFLLNNYIINSKSFPKNKDSVLTLWGKSVESFDRLEKKYGGSKKTMEVLQYSASNKIKIKSFRCLEKLPKKVEDQKYTPLGGKVFKLFSLKGIFGAKKVFPTERLFLKRLSKSPEGDFSSEKSFWNQTFDKGRLKNFVLWFLLKHGEYKTVKLVEELKTLGFEYATKAGISLGIEDLKIPKKKNILIMEAEQLSISTIKQYKRNEITGVERFQRLIDTWHRTSERLKQEVIENFEATDILNPVYMMAFSGARGNISQVRQLVGMRGLMSNPQGQIIDFPIRSNFREGLTLTEYIISSYGARKGIVDTALRTANAGYLTRRLVDVAQHVIISNFDCGTKRGIFLTDMKEGNKTIYSLQNRLIGRVLARDVFRSTKDSPRKTLGLESLESNTDSKNNKQSFLKVASRNVEISSDLSISLASICKKVFVRSALTCQTKNLVCQLCYGWSLAQGNLVGIGEAVGVVAAQSIGEPGTQLTMRTFHTGGVFSGDVSDQIRAPFNGIVIYDNPIAGTLIRTPEGKIGFLTKNEGSFTVLKNNITSFKEQLNNFASPIGALGSKELIRGKDSPIAISKKFKIPFYTLLFFKNGEKVIEKEVIAQISSINRQKNATDQAEFTINAELSGQFFSKYLNLKETKVGPKLKASARNKSSVLKEEILVEQFDENIVDTIFESWGWGYAWVLSGKIYQLPLSSNFFPMIGDFVNHKTYMNKNKLSLPSNFGTSLKLSIPLPNSVGHNVFFNKPNIKKMRTAAFEQKKLSENIELTFINKNLWPFGSSPFRKGIPLEDPIGEKSSPKGVNLKDSGDILQSPLGPRKGNIISQKGANLSQDFVSEKQSARLFFSSENSKRYKKLDPFLYMYSHKKNSLKVRTESLPKGAKENFRIGSSFPMSKVDLQNKENTSGFFTTKKNIISSQLFFLAKASIKKKNKFEPTGSRKLDSDFKLKTSAVNSLNYNQKDFTLLKTELISFQLSKITYQKLGYFLKLAPFSMGKFKFSLPEKEFDLMQPSKQLSTQSSILSDEDTLFLFSSLAKSGLSKFKKNKFAYPANWSASFDIFLNWFPKRFSTKTGGLILIEPIFLKGMVQDKSLVSKKRVLQKNNRISLFCPTGESLQSPLLEGKGQENLASVKYFKKKKNKNIYDICPESQNIFTLPAPIWSPTTMQKDNRQYSPNINSKFSNLTQRVRTEPLPLGKDSFQLFQRERLYTKGKLQSDLKQISPAKFFPTFIKRDLLIRQEIKNKLNSFKGMSSGSAKSWKDSGKNKNLFTSQMQKVIGSSLSFEKTKLEKTTFSPKGAILNIKYGLNWKNPFKLNYNSKKLDFLSYRNEISSDSKSPQRDLLSTDLPLRVRTQSLPLGKDNIFFNSKKIDYLSETKSYVAPLGEQLSQEGQRIFWIPQSFYTFSFGKLSFFSDKVHFPKGDNFSLWGNYSNSFRFRSQGKNYDTLNSVDAYVLKLVSEVKKKKVWQQPKLNQILESRDCPNFESLSTIFQLNRQGKVKNFDLGQGYFQTVTVKNTWNNFLKTCMFDSNFSKTWLYKNMSGSETKKVAKNLLKNSTYQNLPFKNIQNHSNMPNFLNKGQNPEIDINNIKLHTCILGTNHSDLNIYLGYIKNLSNIDLKNLLSYTKQNQESKKPFNLTKNFLQKVPNQEYTTNIKNLSYSSMSNDYLKEKDSRFWKTQILLKKLRKRKKSLFDLSSYYLNSTLQKTLKSFSKIISFPYFLNKESSLFLRISLQALSQNRKGQMSLFNLNFYSFFNKNFCKASFSFASRIKSSSPMEKFPMEFRSGSVGEKNKNKNKIADTCFHPTETKLNLSMDSLQLCIDQRKKTRQPKENADILKNLAIILDSKPDKKIKSRITPVKKKIAKFVNPSVTAQICSPYLKNQLKCLFSLVGTYKVDRKKIPRKEQPIINPGEESPNPILTNNAKHQYLKTVDKTFKILSLNNLLSNSSFLYSNINFIYKKGFFYFEFRQPIFYPTENIKILVPGPQGLGQKKKINLRNIRLSRGDFDLQSAGLKVVKGLDHGKTSKNYSFISANENILSGLCTQTIIEQRKKKIEFWLQKSTFFKKKYFKAIFNLNKRLYSYLFKSLSKLGSVSSKNRVDNKIFYGGTFGKNFSSSLSPGESFLSCFPALRGENLILPMEAKRPEKETFKNIIKKNKSLTLKQNLPFLKNFVRMSNQKEFTIKKKMLKILIYKKCNPFFVEKKENLHLPPKGKAFEAFPFKGRFCQKRTKDSGGLSIINLKNRPDYLNLKNKEKKNYSILKLSMENLLLNKRVKDILPVPTGTEAESFQNMAGLQGGKSYFSYAPHSSHILPPFFPPLILSASQPPFLPPQRGGKPAGGRGGKPKLRSRMGETERGGNKGGYVFCVAEKKEAERRIKISGRTIKSNQKHQAIKKKRESFKGKVPINFVIKPGWPYFTNHISNYILYNKKLIQPGKVIGNELIFDRESIFLEIIPFNDVISLLTVNDNLSKSYFSYTPFTLLPNYNLSKTSINLRNDNIFIKEKSNFWVTKLVIKNKKCRYYNENIEQSNNLNNIVNSSVFVKNKPGVKADFQEKIIASPSPAEPRKVFKVFSQKEENSFFEQSNDHRFFVLLRPASEYKVIKDSEYKKEIHKISYFNKKTNIPISLHKREIFSQNIPSGKSVTATKRQFGIKTLFQGKAAARIINSDNVSTGHWMLGAHYREKVFSFNKFRKTAASNTSFNTINLFSEFKTELLNKQKIASQTISKFPVSSLQVFSNSSFYSSFVMLKQKLINDYLKERILSKNLGGFANNISFLNLQSKSNTKLFENKQTSISIIKPLKGSLVSANKFVSFNFLQNSIYKEAPITVISPINLSPLILSSKYPFAFDFLFKIPMRLFSEQYNLKLIFNNNNNFINNLGINYSSNIDSDLFDQKESSKSSGTLGSKFAPLGTERTPKGPGNFGKIPKILSPEGRFDPSLNPIEARESNGPFRGSSHKSQKVNNICGTQFHPIKKFLNNYLFKIHNLKKFKELSIFKFKNEPGELKIFTPTGQKPDYFKKAFNLDFSYSPEYVFERLPDGDITPNKFEKEIFPLPNIQTINKNNLIDIFNLYKVKSILSSFFYCPLVEYSLGTNFEKSLLEGFPNNLTNFFPTERLGQNNNLPTTMDPYFKSNVNNVYNKNFLTKKYSFSLSNRKIGFVLGSLNNFLDFRSKYRINKEIFYYKTEFESFRNNQISSLATNSFINTYTYCSFEGEFIFISGAKSFKTGSNRKILGVVEQDINNLENSLFVNKRLIDSCMILTKKDQISYYFKNINNKYIGKNLYGKNFLTKSSSEGERLLQKKQWRNTSPGLFLERVNNLNLDNTQLKFDIKYYAPFFLEAFENLINVSDTRKKNKNLSGQDLPFEEESLSSGGRSKKDFLDGNYKEIYFSLENLKKKNQYLINDTVIKFLNILDSKEDTELSLWKPSNKTKTENNQNFAQDFPEILPEVSGSNNFSEFNFKINKVPMGMSQQTNRLLLGEFLVYGDQISPDFSVTKPGQIIHINNNKITIRKGQSIFVSPKAILHKYDTDFIEEQSPVITLSYQQLKTGDIIEGIPKVEQFFEARTTKRGRLFRDSLSNLLKGLFKRYCSKGQPLDQAVRQSFYKIQQIIVDGVQRVYRSQGVSIADKHLEVIVKQMTSKVRIIEGGQTGFFPGEIVDLNVVEEVNSLLMRKISYEPLVLGITKASLEVDSFLSAASFQQTTRVLSNAAISKKKDFLKGLKENVILGNLIPAGTGYLVYLIP